MLSAQGLPFPGRQSTMTRCCLLIFSLFIPTQLIAQAPPGQADVVGNDSATLGNPVAIWHFDGTQHAGPRPPVYAGLAPGNTAAFSDGKTPVAVVKGSD